jgi:hypothetical protein
MTRPPTCPCEYTATHTDERLQTASVRVPGPSLEARSSPNDQPFGCAAKLPGLDARAPDGGRSIHDACRLRFRGWVLPARADRIGRCRSRAPNPDALVEGAPPPPLKPTSGTDRSRSPLQAPRIDWRDDPAPRFQCGDGVEAEVFAVARADHLEYLRATFLDAQGYGHGRRAEHVTGIPIRMPPTCPTTPTDRSLPSLNGMSL